MDSNNVNSGFSFKFSKTVQLSKVDRTKIKDEGVKAAQELEFVKAVEGNEIQSSKPKEVKSELIIPLITNNVWRYPKSEKSSKSISTADQPKTLEEQALSEIIEDSKRLNEDLARKVTKNDSLIVPLLLQNKLPEGFETDDKLDVSLRPESSSLDDYESVPIEHFGLAALKGMGWKPGDGIGRTNKKCVAPLEVTVRPRGLGLGANLKDLEARKAEAANQKEYPLVVGACVRVMEGNKKGLYGEIQSMDDELGRVVVKMTDEKIFTLPEVFVKGVSKEELKKEKKVLNKTTYEEYKKETADDSSAASDRDKAGKKRKHKDRSRSSSPSKNHNRHRADHKKKKKNKDRHREKSESPPVSNLWIHPQLKMRIIDQKYKKGKYFNTKVIIEDVITPTTCVCRTEDGKFLEDIDVGMLETVVPKSESSYVMVLQGEFKGRVASILSRDRSKCVATMHLLPDHQKVIKLSYDSICEFVGDVSLYE